MTADVTAPPTKARYKYDRLEARKDLIDAALACLVETVALDLEFSREQHSRRKAFVDLEKALSETDLKIVVIGEFSRGKSSLLNALLGVDILPTAMQQTTAINTFVRGVRDDEKPYIKVIYFDGKVAKLPWEQDALERWGTELDDDHRDLRTEIERIEAYSDHPLLKNNLVLIDTPGFEGILERHEEIARSAMNESHVALWIQSADQLGGNAREWEFLRSSIARNFNKFITIINKWDFVLAPQDRRAQAQPLQQRIDEYRSSVIQNFNKHAGDSLAPENIKVLTSPENLMGVSASWALSTDPEKQKQSNIQQLAERIESMFLTSEANEEMVITPLMKLSEIQHELRDGIQHEHDQLEKATDLEELKNKKLDLELQIKDLELNHMQTVSDSEKEHAYHAHEKIKEIQEQLTTPLKNLKAVIEIELTEQYIVQQIERGVQIIELPPEAGDQFTRTYHEIGQLWSTWRRNLERTLSELRAEYAREMQQAGEKLSQALSTMNLALPALDIELNIDLGPIQRFHEEKLRLEQQRDEFEEQLHNAELKRAELTADPAQLKHLEDRRQRVERRLQGLGNQPAPQRVKKTIEESNGTWSRTTTRDVEVNDFSNVQDWKNKVADLEKQEKEYQKEIDAFRRKQAENQNQSRAILAEQQRMQRQLERVQRKIEDARKSDEAQRQLLIDSTFKRLQTTTVHQIERNIAMLENDLSQSVQQAFDDHLAALKARFEEKLLEPIHARQQSLNEVLKSFEKGELARQNRLVELNQLLKQATGLIAITNDIMGAAKATFSE